MRRLTCHCGAVEIAVRLAADLGPLQRCTCSYCRRRGTIVASVAGADLTILRGEGNLALYVWGTGTAQHWFCKTCGIHTHHRRRSDPRSFGVNVGALEGVDPAVLGNIAWSDGMHHPADHRPG